MRILHLLASPYFSGPAELVALLALEQRRMGHEVAVAIDLKRQVAPSEELAAPRFRALGLLADLGVELSVKSSPLALARDVRALRAVRCDVVHSHFSHDHVLARMAAGGRRALVRSIHAPRSLRRLMPRADAWTVPFEGLARRLLGERVALLTPLVAPDFLPAVDRRVLRVSLGLPTGPLVGMVSTFQASRRHHVGVEAFRRLVARVPEARLVLLGDGPLEADLRRAVGDVGLDSRVHFAGYRSGGAFVEALQALDEVWVLGLGNDFSGRCAAQARAVGCRIVAVREGALERFADALVEPVAERVAEVALAADRAVRVPESPAAVAGRVQALYEAVAR